MINAKVKRNANPNPNPYLTLNQNPNHNPQVLGDIILGAIFARTNVGSPFCLHEIIPNYTVAYSEKNMKFI